MNSIDLRRTRLGILGGGQLARMLALASQEMGVETHILTERADDPAAQVCSHVHLGSIRSGEAVQEFLSKITHAIFENEFIPRRLLEEAARGTSVEFIPSLDALEFLQNKLNQKALLARLKIPSAAFEVIPSGEREFVSQHLRLALKKLGGHGVLKWAELGYDGKGTLFLEDKPEKIDRALVFIEEAAVRGIQVFIEERVSFKRELAILGTHQKGNGDFQTYPLVASEQEDGVCRRVYGPARALGVSAALEKQAARWAESIAQTLPLHGVFAIELFLTNKGKLLVNELAPRVHNSGHYTQNAAATSQFQNHIRAILGMPLGSTECAPSFAMENLLGPECCELAHGPLLIPHLKENQFFHWYGKQDLRPGRKVGHLNTFSPKRSQIKKISLDLQKVQFAWVDSLNHPNREVTRERKPKK